MTSTYIKGDTASVVTAFLFVLIGFANFRLRN